MCVGEFIDPVPSPGRVSTPSSSPCDRRVPSLHSTRVSIQIPEEILFLRVANFSCVARYADSSETEIQEEEDLMPSLTLIPASMPPSPTSARLSCRSVPRSSLALFSDAALLPFNSPPFPDSLFALVIASSANRYPTLSALAPHSPATRTLLLLPIPSPAPFLSFPLSLRICLKNCIRQWITDLFTVCAAGGKKISL